jgi:3-hydroxyisobutyrate dehydrogenase-like beta-hydroxyacid dehydrogenase
MGRSFRLLDSIKIIGHYDHQFVASSMRRQHREGEVFTMTQGNGSIGWIGLGAMGGAMARRVAAAGFPLIVHDKRSEAMAPLEAMGASVASSAAAVAEAADIVFVCLASEEASLSVATEIFAVTDKPGIYVEHSTLTPRTMNQLAAMAAAAGVTFLDAPVSGSKVAREAGQLSVMVGGDDAAMARIRPILDTVGSKIFHLGAVGTGSVAKISNNLIALTNLLSVMQGLLLGVKQGIPMERLRDAVMAGTATSPIVAHVANLYISRSYRSTEAPEAIMRLVIKDLMLAKELADDSGVRIDLGLRAMEVWQEAVDAGLGETELFTMIDYLEGGR